MTGSTEHPGGMGQASDTKQLRRRRLDVPGTKVHLEPVTSGEGRPLREPRPREAPYDGPSSQETFSQGMSSQDTPSRGKSSRSPDQGELFAEPGEGRPAPGPLMAGEMPSGTGLAHRWHRRRGLFAELRALEKAESAGEKATNGDASGNRQPCRRRRGPERPAEPGSGDASERGGRLQPLPGPVGLPPGRGHRAGPPRPSGRPGSSFSGPGSTSERKSAQRSKTSCGAWPGFSSGRRRSGRRWP